MNRFTEDLWDFSDALRRAGCPRGFGSTRNQVGPMPTSVHQLPHRSPAQSQGAVPQPHLDPVAGAELSRQRQKGSEPGTASVHNPTRRNRLPYPWASSEARAQIAQDFALQPPQDQGSPDLAQVVGGAPISAGLHPALLDEDAEAPVEGLQGPEQAGLDESEEVPKRAAALPQRGHG